jgi:FkbM family methyltransferase
MRLFMNRNHPRYSKILFKFCAKYVDFCYGDYDFDRRTNGEYQLLKKIIPTAKVVFDVGANIGDYASEIRKNNPVAIVHCFEPDPRAFLILKEKNGLLVYNTALGNKSGAQALHLSDKSEHSSFVNTEKNSRDSQIVTMSTLDEHCQKNSIHHIDFMKIDVEGYEFFVLEGARELFKNRAIDVVQFEFSGATVYSKTFLKDFIDFFASYGYSLYRVKPLCLEKVIYYPDQERFTLTNYLAVKDGLPLDHLTITESFYH